MADIVVKFDPKYFRDLTPEEKARLDALTDEEITAAALSDPDNPPLTDEEIERFAAARLSKTIRDRLSITQEQFAERFHISYGRLRDLEQGRTHPDSALLAYLKVIEHDPEAVLRVLSAA